jgi:pimeloyl-ACP methyl ester carboxylesterase
MKASWVVALAMSLPIAADGQVTEMVDVGSHRLEVFSHGDGAPTVVLEAALGYDASSWDSVFPHISEFTSVISYSRAGLGGSEPASSQRGYVEIAEELHVLLDELAVPRPVVLVGHSIGGLSARVYTSLYPEEVAGLVLVDGTHERQFVALARIMDGFWDSIEVTTREHNDSGGALAQEWNAWMEIAEAGRLPVSAELPSVPMAVITAAVPGDTAPWDWPEGGRIWRSLHDEWFNQTTLGLRIVTDRSDHQIPRNEPHLVVEAVRQVVEWVRAGRWN